MEEEVTSIFEKINEMLIHVTVALNDHKLFETPKTYLKLITSHYETLPVPTVELMMSSIGRLVDDKAFRVKEGRTLYGVVNDSLIEVTLILFQLYSSK